jgi:hypothetical protein
MKIPQSGLDIGNPAWPLLAGLVSYWGVTTADGAGTGLTLICADLANEPDYTGHQVGIWGGPAAGQASRIESDGFGTLTVKWGFTNPAGASQTITAGIPFVILKESWGLDITAILAAASTLAKVQEVVLYPVAIQAGNTELADDGTAPAFYPVAAHSTNSHDEANPGVAWQEDITLEPDGSNYLISIYAEFEWQTRFLVGAGAGTQSSSKVQISRDGGANWVDLTDNFDNAAAVMTNRIRAGVGRWIATVVAGAGQLSFRLVHWTDDATGVSTSEAQIRSNSYVRLTYRKS